MRRERSSPPGGRARGAAAATLALTLALVAGACAPEPLALPEGCQPLLGGLDCLLPYPSDFFRHPGPPARVAITGAARLLTVDGQSADLHDAWSSDGFSRVAPIGARFARRARADQLTRVVDPPERSVALTSPTVLLEAATGRRVEHFVDVDPDAVGDDGQVLTLRARAPLAPATTYVVAFVGLVDESGALIAAPEGFRRLRDGEPSSDLDALAEAYDETVAPALERAGVDADAVQLAFSFTTGSADGPRRDLLDVRAQTLAWLERGPPMIGEVHTTSRADGPIAWIVEGQLRSPLFLDADDGAALARDAEGRVFSPAERWFSFRAQVPRSALTATAAAVGFGHGFFGGRDAVDDGARETFGDEQRVVLFAIDWLGFSAADLGPTLDALARRPADFARLTERLHQAYAHWLVLSAAIEGPLRAHPAFAHQGRPVYAAGPMAYYGVSAGHILGGALPAIAPRVERFGFVVGGAGITHIMARSQPVGPLMVVLGASLPDPVDRQKFLLLAQETLDRVDPATYAELALTSPLPGAPRRTVLLQAGLGDASVPTSAALLHARALGLELVSPSAGHAPGLPARAARDTDRALVLYDFGVDPQRELAATPFGDDTPVHSALPRDPRARAQLGVLFRDGVIVDTCGGPCTGGP